MPNKGQEGNRGAIQPTLRHLRWRGIDLLGHGAAGEAAQNLGDLAVSRHGSGRCQQQYEPDGAHFSLDQQGHGRHKISHQSRISTANQREVAAGMK